MSALSVVFENFPGLLEDFLNTVVRKISNYLFGSVSEEGSSDELLIRRIRLR